MPNSQLVVPRIALLGICHRARFEQGNPPSLSQLDILGLRKVVLPYIYPFDASAYHLVLAVFGIELSKPIAIVLRDRTDNPIFRADISISSDVEQLNEGDEQANNPASFTIVSISDEPCWTILLVRLSGVILTEPQKLSLYYIEDGINTSIGKLVFALAKSQALTHDRVSAIKSDPKAIKAVRLNLGCKYCDTKMKVIAALEKPAEVEDGLVWYQDVPEAFKCRCGKTVFPLNILRNNMHTLLGNNDITIGNLSVTALYERRVIDNISMELSKIINANPKEEDIQQFLENNPIVFHFLYPLRLYEKPAILSKYKADFASLDSSGVLTLVEIERPGIRLIRKDGATSAEMEHAISQVRDWLFLYEKHRGAVLDCLGLRDQEVTKIKGIVIAGRNKGHDSEKIRRFKWQDRGAIECMTYDDLLGILASLDRDMRAM